MVTNEDVVAALELIADLLEIKGENTYKVRAYRQAAVEVENLGTPLNEIAESQEGLAQVGGFGPAISDKVAELLQTGKLEYLENLRQEIPTSLIEVRRLPGVGPRTAAMLWKEAGVTNVDELAAAVASGKLEGLPRLGPKTVEKITEAVHDRLPLEQEV